MQAIAPQSAEPAALSRPASSTAPVASAFAGYQIIRRNGAVVVFEPNKIAVALMKAFLAVHGTQGAASASVRETVDTLTEAVVRALLRSRPGGGTFHIEDVQDSVELGLMRGGHHEVARAYVLYRERRTQERARQGVAPVARAAEIHVIDNGQRVPLDGAALQSLVESACAGLGADVKAEPILAETRRNLYDGVPIDEVYKASILAARTLIEKEPAYTRATARLLLHTIRREILGGEVTQAQMGERYAEYFPQFIKKGVQAELLDDKLLQFDLARLGAALMPERDLQFDYLGLQTLYDRYFLHIDEQRIEMPQAFFMRVAMGLALNEIDREARAIEFYDVLSSFDFMSSTPTLFNAGTRRSAAVQLLPDHGGRRPGRHLRGAEGKRAAEQVRRRPGQRLDQRARAGLLHQGHQRQEPGRGAVPEGGQRHGGGRQPGRQAQGRGLRLPGELAPGHRGVPRAAQEHRRRPPAHARHEHRQLDARPVHAACHGRRRLDAVLAQHLPRPARQVRQGLRGGLHRLRSQGRPRRDQALQAHAGQGPVAQDAVDAVRDRASVDHLQGRLQRAPPQQHVGVVHSSNLCTEITLNTSDTEIAVCNLGSVNLAQHLQGRSQLDQAKLKKTIATAMRMLDNVIDINYYAVKKARDSNLRHRPVGLGIMGFQDSLYQLRVPYASDAAVEFADRSMEAVCYHAYWASTELAEERGRYSSYRGSLWDRGMLPLDSLDLLAEQRGGYVEVDRSQTMDWDALRARIREHGMRNSNCVAIAPTATISNIIGVDASIEPCFGNLSVKSNLSGEFTVVNEYLVRDLKRLGLWDDVMVMDLKHFDGSLRRIDRVPEELKRLYATAFEVETQWLVEAAARRQKWIDQAQSLNIYMAGASGKKLDETYKLAWLRGLKTTYYLRTMGATHAEKSTVHSGAMNAVSAQSTAAVAASAAQELPSSDIKFCSIDEPDCEACQ